MRGPEQGDIFEKEANGKKTLKLGNRGGVHLILAYFGFRLHICPGGEKGRRES